MNKNLIIITLDAVRKDRVGVYGNKKKLTPNIDHLAKSALIYDNCFTVSNTSAPSHTSLLSGCYPTTHGVRKNGWRIPEETMFISDMLKKHGYKTGGAVSQELLSSVYGFSKGFDTFYDNSRMDKLMWYLSKIGTPRRNLRKLLQYFNIVKSHSRSGRKTLHEVMGWLEKSHSAPFFLFVHFFDAHRNTFAEENKGVNLSEAEAYEKNIEILDGFIGSIVEKLKQLKIKKDTTIVLMADHGECIGEGNKKGHGWTLLDVEFRVPFIIHDEMLQQKRIANMCRTIDMVPTVLDLIGITPKVQMDGVNLAEGKEISEVYMEGCLTFLDIRGVRTPTWKYIIEQQRNEILYNVEKDPQETTDVKKGNQQILTQLREKVKKHFSRESKEQDTDEHTKEMLRKLGYLE